jgi:hypothetical protein
MPVIECKATLPTVPAYMVWPQANEDPSLAIHAKKLPPYPAGNHYDEGQDVP